MAQPPRPRALMPSIARCYDATPGLRMPPPHAKHRARHTDDIIWATRRPSFGLDDDVPTLLTCAAFLLADGRFLSMQKCKSIKKAERAIRPCARSLMFDGASSHAGHIMPPASRLIDATSLTCRRVIGRITLQRRFGRCARALFGLLIAPHTAAIPESAERQCRIPRASSSIISSFTLMPRKQRDSTILALSCRPRVYFVPRATRKIWTMG